MSHVRSKMYLEDIKRANDFVTTISECRDVFMLENFDGSSKVNARSILGVLYMLSEYPNELFLVNMTRDGEVPYYLDKFRAM